MERGRDWFLALWRNPLGTAVLYGAFLVHLADGAVVDLSSPHLADARRGRPPSSALGLTIPTLLAAPRRRDASRLRCTGRTIISSRRAQPLGAAPPTWPPAVRRADPRLDSTAGSACISGCASVRGTRASSLALRHRGAAAGAGAARFRQRRARRRGPGSHPGGRRGCSSRIGPAPAPRSAISDRVGALRDLRRRTRRWPWSPRRPAVLEGRRGRSASPTPMARRCA